MIIIIIVMILILSFVPQSGTRRAVKIRCKPPTPPQQQPPGLLLPGKVLKEETRMIFFFFFISSKPHQKSRNWTLLTITREPCVRVCVCTHVISYICIFYCRYYLMSTLRFFFSIFCVFKLIENQSMIFISVTRRLLDFSTQKHISNALDNIEKEKRSESSCERGKENSLSLFPYL